MSEEEAESAAEEDESAAEEESAAESWGDSADAWAKAGEKPETGAGAAVAEWMLEAAALEEGEHVVEIACGAGRVGLQAAEIVGSGGVVICSDFAEPMVKAVREKIRALGFKNAEAWVLDASNLRLRTGERFDAVLCRFGYMLMSDPLGALRESHGALKPDGRLVLGVWGEAGENPWLSTILSAVMAHFDAPAPKPGTPGPFSLGDRERLEDMLVEAGFADVSVKAIEAEQTYDSLDGWWEEIREVSGPLAAVLSKLPDDAREAIRKRSFDAAGEYVGGDGEVVFPAVAVGARATRPAPDAEG
ncbi:MAG: class I SAM-dependent methyltransferase [Solirubrobacterales bacterium]